MPGETYTWSNVVSIPGSRLTKTEVSLSCEQNEKVIVVPVVKGKSK